MPSQILFANLPYNCSDRELVEWIESRGIEVESIRIIRDLVSGASPAFAYADLKDDSRLKEAVTALNGSTMGHQTILAKPVTAARPVDAAVARVRRTTT